MIQNLTDNIKHKEHKVEFSVELPTVLSSIRADDANFEIVVSNTCNITNLYNKRSKFLPSFDKTITKIIGKACVQESFYHDADEFDRERLHRQLHHTTNYLEKELDSIDVGPQGFDEMYAQVEEFEKTMKENDELAIVIYNFGLYIDMTDPYFSDNLQPGESGPDGILN